LTERILDEVSIDSLSKMQLSKFPRATEESTLMESKCIHPIEESTLMESKCFHPIELFPSHSQSSNGSQKHAKIPEELLSLAKLNELLPNGWKLFSHQKEAILKCIT
jgi:hypothetical protein